MQIVIEISDYDKEWVTNGVYIPDEINRKIAEAIINGIPLDKIKTEIADLDDADYDYEGYYKAVTDAVKIIDKYKAESEE